MPLDKSNSHFVPRASVSYVIRAFVLLTARSQSESMIDRLCCKVLSFAFLLEQPQQGREDEAGEENLDEPDAEAEEVQEKPRQQTEQRRLALVAQRIIDEAIVAGDNEETMQKLKSAAERLVSPVLGEGACYISPVQGEGAWQLLQPFTLGREERVGAPGTSCNPNSITTSGNRCSDPTTYFFRFQFVSSEEGPLDITGDRIELKQSSSRCELPLDFILVHCSAFSRHKRTRQTGLAHGLDFAWPLNQSVV